MPLQIANTHPSEPFRWKLFLLVMFIMGTITTVAIVLTLLANPAKDSVHAPTVQPISQINLTSPDHPLPS